MDGVSVETERTAMSERLIDAPFRVVENFLPTDLASLMRRDLETHFRIPNPTNSSAQQIWNYQFSPGISNYFRTYPSKIFQQKMVRHFVDALQSWSAQALGINTVSWPVFRFYLPGCGQERHDEAANGRMAYFYSLTSNIRGSRGGRTMVFEEGEAPSAAIEPAFNSLILCDTRSSYAIEQLTGSKDPLDGRLEMHGYISESPPIVEGALTVEEALSAVGEVVNEVFAVIPEFTSRYHGPLCLRIEIEESGSVRQVETLLHRVMPVGTDDFNPVLAVLRQSLQAARFPKSSGKTSITLPIVFGGFLPSLASGA